MVSDNSNPVPFPPRAPARTGRLDHLQTRKRLTGAQAEARSRNIRRLRLILPTLAGLMLLAFFLASRNAPQDDARLDDLTIESVTPKEAIVTRPRYAGLDRDGQPFEITAETATQDNTDDDQVRLTKPQAKMQDGNATTVATARSGQYYDQERVLMLSDDVLLERVINGETFILRSNRARVDIETEEVTSDNGVIGQSNRGRLSADRVKVFNQDRRIEFDGNVRMKFEPGAMKSLSGALKKPEKAPKKPEGGSR